MFMFADAALCTKIAYAPASMRPSSSSMGTKFAPRAYMAAPLMRKKRPKPEPEPSAPVLLRTVAGSVSFTVTSAATRKPRRRVAVTGAPLAGTHVAVTLYSGCAPSPFGHQRRICAADAARVSETAESPAGTSMSGDAAVAPHAPAKVSVPVEPPSGAHRCAVTFTAKPACAPSASAPTG